MTFLLPFMLAGLALTALPVLLHLIMRQQPKQLPFPAFRFLKQLHKTNQRKLRLRHLLLLAMRMLLIAALCLALARPRVLSEKLHLAGEQPVAAVLIVDTSPSMEYAVGGKSRLDEAKQRVAELLGELAEGSEAALLDTADVAGGEWLPPKVAAERAGALTIKAGSESVTRAVARAYGLFQERDANASASPGQADANLPRFLYVFSDRTVNCWDGAQLEALKAQRDRMTQPAAGVFIDVGVENAVDLAVTDAEPVRQAVPANQPVTLRVTVRSLGQPADTQVACRIADRAAARPVKLAAGQSQTVEFTFTDLPTGYHQAEVALPTHDSLPFNDVRFVTVEVRAPREVLIIADDPARANFFQLSLNEHKLFRAETRRTAEAAGMAPQDFKKYQVIALLDVARPNDPPGSPLWERLRGYVAAGGSLAVIPGGNEADGHDYNDVPAAQELMPGRLEHPVEPGAAGREPEALDWDGSGFQHEFLAPFQRDARRGDVDYFVRNPPRAALYWAVKPYDAQNVVLRYADSDKPEERRPALLERPFKGPDGKARGKVMLFTSPLDGRRIPVTRPDGATRPEPANNFLQSSFFVVLTNRAVSYLAGDFEDTPMNFRTGPEVMLPLPPAPRFPSYTLEGPGVTGSDTLITADQKKDAKGKPTGEVADDLRVRATGAAGNFTVRGAKDPAKGGGETWQAKYSLNPAPAESQLDRVPAEQIEQLFGPGSVLPVGQRKSLHEALSNRFTQPVDLFPWLMMLLLLVLAVENLLANKFYKSRPPGEDEAGPPPPPPAGA
jgi:hypothetical protein